MARPQKHRTVFLVAHSFGTCLAVRLAAALGSALAGLVLVGAFHPGLGGGAMRSLFLLPETVRSPPALLRGPTGCGRTGEQLGKVGGCAPSDGTRASACQPDFHESVSCSEIGGQQEKTGVCGATDSVHAFA